ncbi:MAG: hypothetical protein K2Y05_12930 [Hyphomicrobiaceae bacterium]|nr:hypothetical protein [Hyphomicrobiaceae bacterium]
MRRILFVGSPFGAFFRHIAPALEARGSSVWRTVSDGGEFAATPAHNRLIFSGVVDAASVRRWEAFLRDAMRRLHISAIVTFNDSCIKSTAAHRVARGLGIPRYVLEEGYLRPHWVTFDHEGVNGNTLLPRDPGFYLDQKLQDVTHETFKQSFRFVTRDTIAHFAACTVMSPVLPYDPSYYGDDVWTQAGGYVREYVWRKTHREKPVLRTLSAAKATGRKTFVALMQKPGDSQLRYHSRYRANNPYLEEVIRSFAANAAPDAILVVKQHPLDYGVEKSKALFDKLVAECALEGRAHYIRKLQIEKVLEVASGLITINSTGGMAAIERHLPVIALGNAVYDMPGLTFQNGIDRFWSDAEAPDVKLVAAFVNYLKTCTQINGGYYTRRQLTLLTENLVDRMMQDAIAPHVGFVDRRADKHAVIPEIATAAAA